MLTTMRRPSSTSTFSLSPSGSFSDLLDYERVNGRANSPSPSNYDNLPTFASAPAKTPNRRPAQKVCFTLCACLAVVATVASVLVHGGSDPHDRLGLHVPGVPDAGIGSPSSGPGPLPVRNMPTKLAWAPWYSKAEAHVLSVDYFSNFNPSILELSDGSQIFASRTGWLYSGNCKAYEDGDDADALYNCLKVHELLYSEHTVIGRYDSASSTLNILTPDADGPSTDADGGSFTYLNGTTDWNSGAAWYDTRLLFPYNRRFPIEDADANIIITSQTTELFKEEDWFELENSNRMVLQSVFIGRFDPRLENGIDPVKDGRLKRWAYYDPKAELEELHRRWDGVSEWKLSAADVAQFKCKPRPRGFPPLPFGSLLAKELNEEPNPKSTRVDRHHRRLAAIVGDETSVVVDKNWAPFAYQDRVLWSYDLDPHIVCENDVGLDNDLDCVFCIHKYTSNSSAVLDPFRQRFLAQGFNETKIHLNGAPSYFIPELGGFLGIMHVVNVKQWRGPAGRPEQTRHYKHYFYVTESEPPFELTRVASREIPLHKSRCISPWFSFNDTVTVAFVMYMQYHPDRSGNEIILSYGDGDRYSRTATLGLGEVLDLF